MLRTIAEVLVLFLVLFFLLRAVLTAETYQPYDKKNPDVVSGKDQGFLALSYLGVDRTGTDTLISSRRLEEHLQALSALGYVTISQQDIIDYYEKGIPLPDRALFLMFEDGRKDTAVFSEKLLEKYHYQATVLSYAEKFETKDGKFLMPKDLKKLKKSTWWELGSNGYRLSYINAYDRYDRFLGELISREYIKLTPYMKRNYNHYLMDFIRDEDGLPVESRNGMSQRITQDYDRMEQIYKEQLGEMPKAYVLLHANTGRFGNNESVSRVNEENMKRLFSMNFNREGFSHNDRASSIYDLTRMQPQAYWYTNHLLMRIKHDLAKEESDFICFVDGEKERAKDWEVTAGAAEFQGDQIILTSEPDGKGSMKLSGFEAWKDVHVTVRLTGNKLGVQSLGLRTGEDGENGIFVMLENNHLKIRQRASGKETELFSMDLWEFDEHKPVSVEEDKRNALAAELGVRSRYSGSLGEWLAYHQEKEQVKRQEVRTVEEGAQEYAPELQNQDLGDRKLEIWLQDSRLFVRVDGKDAAEVSVSLTEAGGVCLESAQGSIQYSQRNIADDVYDGVFEELVICDAQDSETLLYRNVLTGTEKMKATVNNFWSAVVDWFITNL